MSIRVYNTLSHTKEQFEPVTAGKVGIYLCGPTVYKPSHIGHAVGPIIFDAVKRYLTFRGFQVTWVVNITDVEDKIIAEAAEQGCTAFELAERITGEYLDAMDRLNITGIDKMPKASEHIGDIIRFVERLIDRGAAYVAGGDVYFDVTSDDDYGKLSNRSIDDQRGERELQSGEKHHPGDFALWKEAKPEEPEAVKFDSPWGKGRPGWHIECSVMSTQMLGETFDIHGGGMDLIFPHHENEIAQSESATGKTFAKYWMHNGLTRFNTKKVSKSDPEMQAALERMTLTNLLSEYSGELLRFFVLSTHYRRPIEYSPEEIESKRKGLEAFYRLFERIERLSGQSVYTAGPSQPPEPQASACADSAAETAPPGLKPRETAPRGLNPAAQGDTHTAFVEEIDGFCARFVEAMDDEFNTAAAIAVLFEQAKVVNRFIDTQQLEQPEGESGRLAVVWAARKLVERARLLGLFLEPQREVGQPGDELVAAIRRAFHGERKKVSRTGGGLKAEILRLLQESGAMSVKEITSKLIEIRKRSKKQKDFATADLIRDNLIEAGITLEDRPDGTGWRRT